MSARLSHASQFVEKIASEEAKRFGHKAVGTEHLLLALLKYDEGVVHRVFAALRVTHAQIEQLLSAMSGANEYRGGFRTYTVQAKVVFETSAELADEFNSSSIKPEHLLLALIPKYGEWDTDATRAMILLSRAGLRAQNLRFTIREEIASKASFVSRR